MKKIKNLKIKNSKFDNNKNFYDTLKKSKFFNWRNVIYLLRGYYIKIPTIIYKSNDYLRSSCVPKFVNKKCYLYSNDDIQIMKFIINNKNQPKYLSNKIEE